MDDCVRLWKTLRPDQFLCIKGKMYKWKDIPKLLDDSADYFKDDLPSWKAHQVTNKSIKSKAIRRLSEPVANYEVDRREKHLVDCSREWSREIKEVEALMEK